ADAVLPFLAVVGAQGRRPVQSRRRAGGAVPDPDAVAARALRRRRADSGAADRADRQRQPGVSELADAGSDPGLLRRRPVAARAAAGVSRSAPQARCATVLFL